jgi:hypothetical protein
MHDGYENPQQPQVDIAKRYGFGRASGGPVHTLISTQLNMET